MLQGRLGRGVLRAVPLHLHAYAFDSPRLFLAKRQAASRFRAIPDYCFFFIYTNELYVILLDMSYGIP